MLRLPVVSPCEEPWEKMTPTPSGRHCAACDREVIDFSRMTEARATAHALLFGRGRMCGRVAYGEDGAPIFNPEPARQAQVGPAAQSLSSGGRASSPRHAPVRAAALAVALAASACVEVPPPAPEPPPQPLMKLLPVAGPELAVVTKPEPPLEDLDKDDIPDRDDACPDRPGPATGEPSTNGCPRAFVGIIVTTGDIQIVEKLHFNAGDARPRPEAQAILDEVAKVMLEHPEIKRVRIEGHASHGETNAKKLSEKRAKAVMDALIKAGVDAARLESTGVGEDKPIVPNTTPENKAMNQRVEFVLVDKGDSST